MWTAVVLTALVLQSTVFAQVKLAQAKPDLVALVTIVLAYLEGPSSGALAGFAGGMAEDFLLNLPKGITALSLTLVGYAVGTARQYVVTPSPLIPVARRGGSHGHGSGVQPVDRLPPGTAPRGIRLRGEGGPPQRDLQRRPDAAGVPGRPAGGGVLAGHPGVPVVSR